MFFDTSCNRHFNETVTLRKRVSKYKNMQKLMIEFLKKCENRGIKIARLNSILITKFINLQLFSLILYGVGVRCDRRRLPVLSLLIEKSMFEVYKVCDLSYISSCVVYPVSACPCAILS